MLQSFKSKVRAEKKQLFKVHVRYSKEQIYILQQALLNELHYRRCMFSTCDISDLTSVQAGTLGLTNLRSYLYSQILRSQENHLF